MKINIQAMAISSLILFLAMVSVHATIVTSASDPVFDGAFTETYSSAEQSTYSSLSLDGVTYSAPPGLFEISSQYAGNYNTQGNSLNDNEGRSSQLVFNFSVPQEAFGFNYGALDDNWTVAAYDSSNHLIDSTTVLANHASNAGEFVGIKSTTSNIAYATFSDTTGTTGDWIFVDNMVYSEVPEPANYAVFIFGAAFLFVTYRRSRNWTVPAAL